MNTRESAVRRLDLDPYDAVSVVDPWPVHATIREADELVYLERYGVYATGRYALVRDAFKDWQSLESSAGVGLLNQRTDTNWRPPSPLIEADPPRHDFARQVLSAILNPSALRSLREGWIEEGRRLVSRLVGSERIDGVTDIARAFPLRVFPDAVGIGMEGRDGLIPYGNFGFNTNGPRNQLVIDAEPRIAGIQRWIDSQCQREALSDSGFGAKIWAAADRGEVAHEHAPLLVRSLLTAGIDTTVNGIAATLYALARTPHAFERLRAEPSLIRMAFDEAVRVESPVISMCRTTVRDVAVGDGVVPAGEKLLLSIAGANRDPREYERADEFDLDRDPSGHVGFGMGIHQCVGQHVARLEAESVLTALVESARSISLAGDAVYMPNNTLRTFGSLPLTITW